MVVSPRARGCLWLARQNKATEALAAQVDKLDFNVVGEAPPGETTPQKPQPDELTVLHDFTAGFSRHVPENDTPGFDVESNPDMGLGPFTLTLDIKIPVTGLGYPRLLAWGLGDSDDPDHFPHGRFGFRYDTDSAHNLTPSADAGYKIFDIQYKLPGTDPAYRRITLMLRLGGEPGGRVGS